MIKIDDLKSQIESRLTRLKNSDVFLKIKQRKLDTRRKIELGGLVIKSKMDAYPKEIILGALIFALLQLENEPQSLHQFANRGHIAFHTSENNP